LTNQSTNLSGGCPKVAIINGDDNNRLISFNGRHQLSHRLLGCSDFDSILVETGLDVTNLYVTPNYFRKGARWNLHKFDLVINNVTDPDRNPKCLAVLSKLERDYGASFLNSPRHIAQIGRDRVAAIAAAHRADRARPCRCHRDEHTGDPSAKDAAPDQEG
jgi:hypothetical protein